MSFFSLYANDVQLAHDFLGRFKPMVQMHTEGSQKTGFVHLPRAGQPLEGRYGKAEPKYPQAKVDQTNIIFYVIVDEVVILPPSPPPRKSK